MLKKIYIISMKLNFYDNMLYLVIILILFISIILKYLCTYVFKCRKQ